LIFAFRKTSCGDGVTAFIQRWSCWTVTTWCVAGSRTWISRRVPGPRPFDPPVRLEARESQAGGLVDGGGFDVDAVGDARRALEADGANANPHGLRA
jgi:hypothetical protein